MKSIDGWISLYRSIQKHWVFSNDSWFKWWVIMLFEANHTDNKITLGYNIFEIKRGQTANSLRTWSSIFGVGTKTVVKFFNLLEKDGMITRETIGKGKQSTTLINITNYEEYQRVKETQGGTQRGTRGKREGDTNNNNNKENNILSPRKFYDEQFKNATINKEEYRMFIDILFGSNDMGIELTHVLKIENQVTHEQFVKLLVLKKEHNKSLAELLLAMQNKPKSIKGNTSLYMTLRKWIQTTF